MCWPCNVQLYRLVDGRHLQECRIGQQAVRTARASVRLFMN